MRTTLIILLLLSFYKVEAQASALRIADSLYATANYTKAINAYAKDGSQKASLQIARAYTAIGNFEKAVAQYQNVVAENGDWQIAAFELGKLYIKTKAFEAARVLFSDLVLSDKTNPEYHYYLGESFRELDQAARSVVSYKKAVEVDSTHLKSIFQLGKYYVITRAPSEAAFYLDKGLDYYSNDVALMNLKALSRYNNDQFEKAIPLFERLLELGEKKEHIYMKLAYCYFQTWAFEKSKTLYALLIKKDTDNHEAYFNLGQVYYKDREIDSAKFYVKKSIEVQQVTFEKEYANLAHMYRMEEDLASALTYYRKAFEEDPSDYRIYYQICALVDQTAPRRAEKLETYESFLRKFGSEKRYLSEMVEKRISELKEEIHMAQE